MILAALLILVAARTGAQQPDVGNVEGTVHEARTGLVLEAITVTLVPAAGESRVATTDREGVFRFVNVTAGTHALVVQMAGYESASRPVTVAAGVWTRVRIELNAMLSALDTLRVLASPVAIQRDRTEFGARVDQRALRLLPTPYEPAAAIALTPGVAGDRIRGGAAREANLYQVDGLTVTHPGLGGFLVRLSPAWVESVEVRGLGAGAELGSFQGGMVNLVTRSGTPHWQSGVRSSIEDHAINASNIVDGEVGRERSARREIEVETSGPLVQRRLFLFAAGHLLGEDTRAQTRIPSMADRYLPHTEQRTELRGFGKLTWTPSSNDRVDAAVALGRTTGDNWGLDGYQDVGAAPDYEAPSRLLMLSWQHGSAAAGAFELRAVEAATREHWMPTSGADVPAVRFFAYGDPPTPLFRNAHFEVERRPVTRSLTAQYSREFGDGSIWRRATFGAELSRASWLDRRTRTGNLTWRPARSDAFDPDLPATWFSSTRLPSDWGGEVHLDARTASEAVFLQLHIDVHPRIAILPGIRWTHWRGDLLPGASEDARINAIEVSARDPRIGVIIDPLDRDDFIIKANWGRVHQNLLASFFDRTEGGDVFTNRELWYYHGSPFADPATTFTPAQRNALSSGSPRFTLEQVIRLNETGPVSPDYRQPYVDQFLVGVEKTIGERIRLEGLWIERRNRNLVALVDRNMHNNYHRWERVTVTNLDGNPYTVGDESLVLPDVWIPNHSIRRQLVAIAGGAGDLPMPPGFTLSDTLTLAFAQDLVLQNVTDAYRDLRQIQLSASLVHPTWGATASFVYSRLAGNYNAVTGYEPGTGWERFWELGAGPYVRPNEQTNFEGDLPGINPYEIKIALHGDLPFGLRGGAFALLTRGETFTPYFTLNGLTNRYFLDDGSEIDVGMVYDVAGQRLFTLRRGEAHYADHASLDLRLEKELPVRAGIWRATLDVFNLWNAGTITRINPSWTYPTATSGSMFGRVDDSAVFRAVWSRVQPRTIRLGLTASF